jgi:leucyl aminopeptidase
MIVTFLASPPASVKAPVARVVGVEGWDDGQPVIVAGAKAARFAGRAGQLFEGFAEIDGVVSRLALVGAGDADADDRRASLEKAGGALAAKYRTSGATQLLIDATGLSADDLASVLLALRCACGNRIRIAPR